MAHPVKNIHFISNSTSFPHICDDVCWITLSFFKDDKFTKQQPSEFVCLPVYYVSAHHRVVKLALLVFAFTSAVMNTRRSLHLAVSSLSDVAVSQDNFGEKHDMLTTSSPVLAV